MALTDENGSGMVMPVAPMYGGYGNGNNGGWGNFGGDGAWWLLVLFLFAFNGNGCSRIVFCHNNRRIRKDQIIRQGKDPFPDGSLWSCRWSEF